MATATKPSGTYKEAVFALLRPRRWTHAYEIAEVGGADGLRRLRELRAEGYKIKRRASAEYPGTFEYRLVSTTPEHNPYSNYF